MSRLVRALQLLFPLSLGSILGLAAMSILGPTLHAAGMSPSLTITAPSNGSTVSGTVDVWAAASDVGFAGITFQVNGVNLGSEITSGSCSTSWNTAGAPEGSYTVSATAVDDSGNPTYASPVTVSVINSAPQISGVSAWNITDTGASITWTTNQATDGETDSGTSTSYGTATTASAMSTTHTVALSSLTAGTTYHYVVHAWNILGMSSVTTDLTFATTGGSAPPPTPTAPQISGISAWNISSSSAFVSWTTDQASSGSVNFGTTTSYGTSATDSTTTTSHTVLLSNLSAGTTYHYRVNATNVQSLSSTTSDLTFATSAAAPAPPSQSAPQISGVTAWNIGNTSASITWTTDQATTGTVDSGTAPSYGTTTNAPSSATTHTIVLSNLSAGTTYHYRVNATNTQALSSATGDLTFATTVGSAPPGVTPAPDPGNSQLQPPSTPAPPTAPGLNAPPSVTVTSPLLSTSFGTPAKVMLAATASDSDGSVASVAFYINGTLMGAVTRAPFTLSWVSWNPGTYSIVAVATDNQGASTTSDAVTFYVQNRPGGLQTTCAGADPFSAIGGGTCLASVWVPPGYSPPSAGTSQGGSSLLALDAGPGSGGCTNADPYSELGGGMCVGGGWLPPGTLGVQGNSSEMSGCSTGDPFAGMKGLIGVCINRAWVPAISGKSGD